jgi:hypothetical protein
VRWKWVVVRSEQGVVEEVVEKVVEVVIEEGYARPKLYGDGLCKWRVDLLPRAGRPDGVVIWRWWWLVVVVMGSA